MDGSGWGDRSPAWFLLTTLSALLCFALLIEGLVVIGDGLPGGPFAEAGPLLVALFNVPALIIFGAARALLG